MAIPLQEPRPWGLAIGQSYGGRSQPKLLFSFVRGRVSLKFSTRSLVGFCIMTYLSIVARPPKVCLLTGGIAPMLTPVLDAYTGLWKQCKERNLKYYEMYPGDVFRVKQIVQTLLREPVKLPSGGTLTARRFLQLGIAFGGSPSTFASFHSMLATATVSSQPGENNENKEDVTFTRAFLKYIDSAQSFDDHPIYFWLHESIYADGPSNNAPTNWAAHRAYQALVASDKEYDYEYTSSLQENDSPPTLFFGEHVFPFMAEDFYELSGAGLSKVADRLASKTDWGRLYDADQMRRVLSDGSCKAAAAVYAEDMYVLFEASMKVTARGGPLERCKVWVTNEYQHSGLRDAGAMIFAKLFGMATGTIRTPS
jgi:hypothetical protein